MNRDCNLPSISDSSDRIRPHVTAEPDVITETAATISEALGKVAIKGYDAVLCRIDAPDEVSFLIRLKKAAPTLPVVALTAGTNPALDDLALESGADDVRAAKTDSPETARDGMLKVAELVAISKSTRAHSKEIRLEAKKLVAQHRWLIARNRILSDDRIDQVEQALKEFRPLVVEDNPDQVLFMKRAFAKTSLPCPLPVMGDGVQAINYLSGEGEFTDRTLHPLPTLVILDLKLPKKSGLEVVQWIRSRSEFTRLPIFMLTTAPEHFDEAMALGANDYFTKPMESGGLLDIVRSIAVRWWFFQNAYASQKEPKAKPYPPCPKCDGSRVNQIGHEKVATGRWFPAVGIPETPSSSKQLDYVFLCERCGHSWKSTD